MKITRRSFLGSITCALLATKLPKELGAADPLLSVDPTQKEITYEIITDVWARLNADGKRMDPYIERVKNGVFTYEVNPEWVHAEFQYAMAIPSDPDAECYMHIMHRKTGELNEGTPLKLKHHEPDRVGNAEHAQES